MLMPAAVVDTRTAPKPEPEALRPRKWRRRLQVIAVHSAVFALGFFLPSLASCAAGLRPTPDTRYKALDPPPTPAGELIEHRDLVYSAAAPLDDGGTKDLKLDLFLPPESVARPVPVLVGFHGGAFHHGHRGMYHFMARDLAKAGYAVASVTHRLYGDAVWPACVDDGVAAVHWLREHADEYGLDVTRIGACGRSSGGYVALMLATMPADATSPTAADAQRTNVEPLVRVAISEAGPTSFDPYLWDGSVQGAFLQGFFGDHPPAATSPAARVTDWTAPTLMFHGSRDGTVPYTQSYIHHDRLRAADVSTRLVTLTGTDHDPLTWHREQGVAECVAWLREHLAPAAAAASGE